MMGLLAALCNIFCLGLFVAQQMGNKLGPCSREVLGEQRTRGRTLCQNAMSVWYDYGNDMQPTLYCSFSCNYFDSNKRQ